MSQEAVWISVSSSLKKFHRPLLKSLSSEITVREWEYQQVEDEPSNLNIPLTLLHNYLKSTDHPLHLIGHSTGGIVALLYAKQYPERVKSLSLLGVGVHPLIDWHAHYYTYRQLLPCTREIVLAQMVRALFGRQTQSRTKTLVKLLDEDLKTTPSPHSLFERSTMEPKQIACPLWVGGSRDDMIVDPSAIAGWNNYLKPDDQLWECSQGHHFFHYFYPQAVSQEILKFQQNINQQPVKHSLINQQT
ncbi:alpha/beta hydrolase [Euhalothece natronophila Z-M001]|uniref:Alpha/beta hydrolase n=1 Tax=Euhalothece natronophila Z-M001 TaxID=522448 RepID=A0A5B8NNQ7_9CHRO|nr:alpha/beta hydrolase [Euhalothece natronophila]QDZ40698.1 alpha/beta hydrolase [Euhalothece natronophila Z-M001]